MIAWLRFISKQEYYITKFIKEAQQVGIALTVPLDTLADMEWKDTICLLQANGAVNVKSPVFFAEFPIERITGLSMEATAFLAEYLPDSKLHDLGGDLIVRGGSEFHTGFVYEVDATLKQVAEKLMEFEAPQNGENDIGVPMLACSRQSIRPMDKPLPMFRDITERTGYRRFDLAKVRERIEKQRGWNGSKRPDIRGQWEPKPETRDMKLIAFPGSIESAFVSEIEAETPVS